MFKHLKTVVLDNWESWGIGRKPADISFIRRLSTWQRESDKIVFYAFRHGENLPVLIIKSVGHSKYGEAIRREVRNIQKVWDTVSHEFRESLPRPLGMEELNGVPIYFEEAIPGKAFPEKVQACWSKKRKDKIISETIEGLADWMITFYSFFNIKETLLDINIIEEQFITLSNRFKILNNLNIKEQIFIERLIEAARSLEGQNMKLPPIHGDIWGGSILWGIDGKMRVIDWEFFKPQGLPLEDFLYFAIHPGFTFSNKIDNSLFSEFKGLFVDNLFTSKIREYLFIQGETAGIDREEIFELIMATTLIKLSLERDSDPSFNKSNSWMALFRHYVNNRSQCKALN